MNPSVVKKFPAVTGNVGAAAAMVGLDVMDAAYHTAHSFPGGVPALAQRMGMSANTLAHKVSLHKDTHHLSLREAVTMQEVSQDKRIAQAMCAALGGVFLDLGTDNKHTTMEQVMYLAKEFGDVLVSINDAVADGNVNLNEMHQCERQAAELMAALNATLTAVRSMMPAAPASSL